MLEINTINASIGGSRILKDVTLKVPQQKVFCLMGRNGVGKTTTLRVIMGLLKATNGSVSLDGESIAGLTTDQRARKGIAYVPQGRDIFPGLTVLENLQVGTIARGNKRPEMDGVFELFPVLKEMLQRKGGVLSGGQQQQLAIGRALLTKPKLLILDEPTEGIQPNIIDQIGEAISRLRGEMSILLVEQYLEFAKELADFFAVMDRGAVVADGPIDALSEEVVREYLTV